MPTQELAVGTSVGGRFIVEGLLGMGAMGAVYRARHLGLDASVALKILHPELVMHEEMVSRFLEEARAMASLKSDNIVRILDSGRTRDGVVYLALEYVEGHDLEIELRKSGPLPEKTAVRFALDVCSALAEAHGRGVVHRDLKPENLLIELRRDGSDRIKLTDFGVAKRAQRKRERTLTLASSPVGTPSYMAPEQITDSSDVDGRADIFSLGVVLYEMLTGFLPFGGDSNAESYVAILGAEPTPLLDLADHVSPELAVVVERCLRKQREQRYPDVGELARDLAHFGSIADRFAARATERSVGASEVIVEPSPRAARSVSPYPTPPPVHQTVPSVDSLVHARSPGRWFVPLSLVAGMVLTAALLIEPSSGVVREAWTSLGEQGGPALLATIDQAPRPLARPVAVARQAVGLPQAEVEREAPEAEPPLPATSPPSRRHGFSGDEPEDREPAPLEFKPVSDEGLAAEQGPAAPAALEGPELPE